MSPVARTTALLLGGAVALGGIALCTVDPGGIALVAVGGLIVASVLLEGRYRRGSGQAMGTPGRWQDTGEREIDSESGEPVAVWFDPVSGARRYLPLGERP
ncbi:hypothetical protein [Novosphingobium colocasiae]|uniref:hypothetical protein n=1 Tax=Novosphingobium colocasiae TaxID=1256513 RepID=UPI0035AF5C03